MKLFVIDYVVESKLGKDVFKNVHHQVVTMCDNYKTAMKRVIDSEIDFVVCITAKIADDTDIYLIE